MIEISVLLALVFSMKQRCMDVITKRICPISDYSNCLCCKVSESWYVPFFAHKTVGLFRFSVNCGAVVVPGLYELALYVARVYCVFGTLYTYWNGAACAVLPDRAWNGLSSFQVFRPNPSF